MIPVSHIPGMPLLPVGRPSAADIVEFQDTGGVRIIVGDFDNVPVWIFRVTDLDGRVIFEDRQQACCSVIAQDSKVRLTVNFPASIFASTGMFIITAADINEQRQRAWYATRRKSLAAVSSGAAA